MSAVVAIAGATGAVGSHLAAILRDAGVSTRLGARRPVGGMWYVEAGDPSSFGAFCRGAAVLVNCVGPAYGTRERIVAVAVSAGCHYLDSAAVAAEEPVLALQPPVAVLLGAGATPGLSELMFRWLARQVAVTAPSITGYSGTVDAMTTGAAADFLQLLAGAESGATPASGPLPFFPGDRVACPLVSREALAAARVQGIADLTWYHVFALGSPVLAVLARCRLAQQQRGLLPDAAVDDLRMAANVELAGQEAHQQFVVERSGPDGGKVAVLRSGGTYRLTAAMLAEAVNELLHGNVLRGCHLASAVLDPGCFPRALQHDVTAHLSLLNGRLRDYSGYDTGAI